MRVLMLDIDTLIVLQSDIRKQEQLPDMIRYVRGGGFWTSDALNEHASVKGLRAPQPIYISRFPDKRMKIHDGHHRLVSTFLGGRAFLREDEYVVGDWTYEAYNTINPDVRYVTPFDPRTEVRLADFGEYKAEALRLLDEAPHALPEFARKNRHRYCQPRNIWTVRELAATCGSPAEAV
jgi:hypothetical protein